MLGSARQMIYTCSGETLQAGGVVSLQACTGSTELLLGAGNAGGGKGLTAGSLLGQMQVSKSRQVACTSSGPAFMLRQQAVRTACMASTEVTAAVRFCLRPCWSDWREHTGQDAAWQDRTSDLQMFSAHLVPRR